MRYKIINRDNNREYIIDTLLIPGFQLEAWLDKKEISYGKDPIVTVEKTDAEQSEEATKQSKLETILNIIESNLAADDFKMIVLLMSEKINSLDNKVFPNDLKTKLQSALTSIRNLP